MLRAGDFLEFSGGGKEIRCRVEEIDSSLKRLVVLEEINTLRTGVKYSLSSTTSEGSIVGEGIIRKIDKPPKDAPKGQLLYIIEVTEPFKKVQKREFFRHDCNLPASLIIKEKNDVVDVNVVNISAGGAKVVTNGHVFENATVDFEIMLNDRLKRIPALVLQQIKMDEATSAYKYTLRLQFINMRKGDEETIVKYIFEEYRKKRQAANDKN